MWDKSPGGYYKLDMGWTWRTLPRPWAPGITMMFRCYTEPAFKSKVDLGFPKGKEYFTE